MSKKLLIVVSFHVKIYLSMSSNVTDNISQYTTNVIIFCIIQG